MNNDINEIAHSKALLGQRSKRWAAWFNNQLIAFTLMTIIGAVAYSYSATPNSKRTAAVEYAQAHLKLSVAQVTKRDPIMTITSQGSEQRVYAADVAQNSRYKNNAWALVDKLFTASLLSAFISILLLILFALAARKQRNAVLRDRVIAGTIEVSEKELAKLSKAQSSANALHIGKVSLPDNFETRHLAMIGTTGSGKTTILRQMLDTIEQRGDAALIYDTSGEFIGQYYNPMRGDIILNPFDERGAFWSPFSEIQHPADAVRIAEQLLPSTSSYHDDIWLKAARELVANMMQALWREGNATLDALLDALQNRTSDDIKQWLQNTSSARIFEENAERATASVMFMLSSASKNLQYLKAENEGQNSFSFAHYMEDIDSSAGPKPWIFVPRREDHFEAMKPLMALWLECAARAILARSPEQNRRFWFILDELADLPKVESLIKILPQGRKFGAAVILTFQAIGQMRARYGDQEAEAMLGNCNSKLFMQLGDETTRQWASKTIGTCEVEIQTMSDALAQGKDKGRTTLSSNRLIRAAILESNLRLPPHQAYLLLPDNFPVALIKLTNAHIIARGEPRQHGFIPADISSTLWGRRDKTTKAKPTNDRRDFDDGPV